MEGYHYPDSVLKGIKYLDTVYPKWETRVDIARLDMCDVRYHILAQVVQCLVYETKEVIFWSRDELIDSGFMPDHGMQHFTPLTAEWQFQIRRIWKERG